MKHHQSAARLRELLARSEILVSPNCYDALSAVLVERAGFDATFVSGASLVNAMLGIPDIGVCSYGEYRLAFQNILNAVSIPVMVDVDTGYGGILPIMRMIEEYEAMGIAGIQMEDQSFPKRCAFFGTTVVSAGEMCKRIKAAVTARQNPDFLIIARTDSIDSLGLDEALRRLELYRDAGADMFFVSTPPSKEAIERISELGLPLCATVIEGTVTEQYSPQELMALGFKMVRYPQTLIRATMKAQTKILKIIKETGSAAGYREDVCSQDERSELTGLKRYTKFEQYINSEA